MNEQLAMSHCWKMTVTALESITHIYCLVFREQRIVKDLSAEGHHTDFLINWSESLVEEILWSWVVCKWGYCSICCILFHFFCCIVFSVSMGTLWSGGVCWRGLFWLCWSSRLCVQQDGQGLDQAAMNASLPLTTHTSGSLPGGRDPYKGSLDKGRRVIDRKRKPQ